MHKQKESLGRLIIVPKTEIVRVESFLLMPFLIAYFLSIFTHVEISTTGNFESLLCQGKSNTYTTVDIRVWKLVRDKRFIQHLVVKSTNGKLRA